SPYFGARCDVRGQGGRARRCQSRPLFRNAHRREVCDPREQTVAFVPRRADMNRYLTEFIGSFFLVFTIGCSVLVGTPMAPLAIGASLMVMVYMGGHISGGHYNPAVSLGRGLRGSFAASEYGAYAAAQLLGAVVASLAVWLVTGRT